MLENKKLKISVIIAAGGKSVRLGENTSKQFVLLENKPLLFYSLEKFLSMKEVNEIIISSDNVNATNKMLDSLILKNNVKTISGGELRQDSVYRGFCSLELPCDLVVIHDVARPFFEISDLQNCINEAYESGASVLAVPVTDTIKKVKSDNNNNKLAVEKTIQRDGLYQIQTPQVFKYDLLLDAYKKLYKDKNNKLTFTDEAAMLEHLGKTVSIVIGKRKNIKITFREDLEIAEAVLQSEKNKIQYAYANAKDN